jgi:hypothetical protein
MNLPRLSSKELKLAEEGKKKQLAKIVESTIQKKYQKQQKQKLEDSQFLGISKNAFNISTKLFIGQKGKIYEHLKEFTKGECISHKIDFSMYEATKGVGNTPIYIITKQKLNSGDIKRIYLAPFQENELQSYLEDLEYNFLRRDLCKRLYIKTTKGDGNDREPRDEHELIEDILKRKSLFFKLSSPLDKKELFNVNNFLELAEKCLKYKSKTVSDKLTYLSASHIPEIDADLIEPGIYMKYADHELLITEGGEAKTHQTETITGQTNVSEPTAANLLGSSDGKIKFEGRLHKSTELKGIEEIQTIEDNIFEKLTNYMEQGSCDRGKGTGILTEGYSALRFLGNVKNGVDGIISNLNDIQQQKYLAILRFSDLQRKLALNVFAFNRRIATLCYDLEMEKWEGEGAIQEEADYITAILQTMGKCYRKAFTKLFFDNGIITWLNQGFDSDYKKVIETLAESVGDQTVKESIKARAYSFRHTRGQALKLAWLEVGLSHYIKNKNYNIPKLLESAENHLQRLKNINLDSVKQIVSLSGGTIFDQIEQAKINGLKPKYLKLVVLTFIKYLSEQNYIEDTTTIIYPLSLSVGCYEKIKIRENISSNDTYRSFYEVQRKIKSNSNLAKRSLSDIGLDYDEPTESFIILDKKRVANFIKTTQTTKTTEGETK